MTTPPLLQTSVPNLVCAGDWVRLGDRETKAKGLCQERAYISGLEAANQVRIVYACYVYVYICTYLYLYYQSFDLYYI